MYGLYWCPHCIEQKEMFGDAFHYVPTWSARSESSNELAPDCKTRGSETVPQLAIRQRATERGSAVAEALSDKTGCKLAVSAAGGNRLLFAAIAVLSLAGAGCLGGLASAPLREVRHSVLRFQPEIQLRHCEPQRILDRVGNSRGRDRRRRIRSSIPVVDFLEISVRHAESPAGCGSCGVGLCALSDLRRSLRVDDVVHFVPDVPIGIDLPHWRVGCHREGARPESVNPRPLYSESAFFLMEHTQTN